MFKDALVFNQPLGHLGSSPFGLGLFGFRGWILVDGVILSLIHEVLGIYSELGNSIWQALKKVLGTLLHSTPLHSTLLYSTLLYSTLFYSPLLSTPLSPLGSAIYGIFAPSRPLGSWETSAVTSMRSMFHGAAAFNQATARTPKPRVQSS